MGFQGSSFLRLAVGAFGLVIAGFVVRGFGQLFVGADTARLLSSPLFLGGFGLAVLAAVLSVLVRLGVLELEDEPEG